ncbi:MAG: hypothetical protein ACU84Q_09230 [Gammaproteobacteria bacterium]
MSWDAISGIAEAVGAIGVIISLLYVGVQIRQNTIASRAANYQQWVDTQVNVNRALSDDSDVTALVDKANQDFDSLTGAELLRLQMIFYNHFTQWNVAFTNNEYALVDAEKWQLVVRGYELFMQHTPALQRMWEYCGFVYDDAFKEHVGSVIQRGTDEK